MGVKFTDKLLTLVGFLLLIGLIYYIIDQINKSTETSVISDKGLAALKDPEKRKEINQAIENAKKNHQETGVWIDPVVKI